MVVVTWKCFYEMSCAPKFEQLVDEVELLEANPNYAHVCLQNGCECTVSLRDLQIHIYSYELDFQRKEISFHFRIINICFKSNTELSSLNGFT